MEFHKYRQRALLNYKKFKQTPPTTWTLVKSSWRLYAFCAVILSLQVLPLLSFENYEYTEFSWFGIGTIFGIMAMIFGHSRLIANMNWPILVEVIDWDLVEDKCSAIEDNMR